jgi:hypothetical protein
MFEQSLFMFSDQEFNHARLASSENIPAQKIWALQIGPKSQNGDFL